MIATPAVDLRGGRCVQLVGGRAEEEAISLPDPVQVALDWVERGFGSLHLVDLDAALGTGHNRALLGEIMRALPRSVATQIGGGIRDDAVAEELLALAPSRIVVGTRAIEDPAWRAALARAHPNRVVVAADIRDGQVVTRGWTEGAGIAIGEFLRELDGLPLAGVLCTDVGREGRMKGIDRAGVRTVVEGTRHPVWISGGVTTRAELGFLEEIGAAGAVLGMALYTGTLDTKAVAEFFGRRGTEDPGREGPGATHSSQRAGPDR